MIEKIKNIFFSEQNVEIKNFMDFLSAQEIDKIAEVLDSAMSAVEQNNQMKNQQSLLALVKSNITKELTSSQELFGYRDLAKRFPVDEFLQAYFQ